MFAHKILIYYSFYFAYKFSCFVWRKFEPKCMRLLVDGFWFDNCIGAFVVVLICWWYWLYFDYCSTEMGIKLKQMNTYIHTETRTGSSQKSTVTNPSEGDGKSLSKIALHVDNTDNSRMTSNVKGVSILIWPLEIFRVFFGIYSSFSKNKHQKSDCKKDTLCT